MANQHETVVAAIKTQLLAGGPNRVYAPEAVHRLVFMPDEWAPDDTHQVVYYMWPTTDVSRLGPQSCEITADIEIHVLACKKMDQANENPAAGGVPQRWQYQNDLAADVKEAIFTNYGGPTFGGTARRLRDHTIIADFQRFLPQWAMVELIFTVVYATNRPGR